MSDVGRFVIFLTVVLAVFGGMHLYVFWRAWSLPFIATRVPKWLFIASAVFLGASYFLARALHRQATAPIGTALEWIGANWLGVLFLLMVLLLLVDLVTLFGFVFKPFALQARTVAVIAALLLSVVALVQGLRPPVMREYEVRLADLPIDQDGLVIVHMSDLHLGSLIGKRWLSSVVQRVNEMNPHLIVVVGDLIDGNVDGVEPLVPVLRKLQAPMGVWAVTGNHEHYASLERSLKLFADAGFHTLRDTAVEIKPGLVIAGVDDLGAHRQFQIGGKPMETALNGRPQGFTILLNHTPWQAEKAASLGVNLMLSGHTHNGQIWPFGWFEKPLFPLLGGRYEVQGMTAIVSHGTGTWGPRMRLWRPSEIVKITLRSDKKQK